MKVFEEMMSPSVIKGDNFSGFGLTCKVGRM